MDGQGRRPSQRTCGGEARSPERGTRSSRRSSLGCGSLGVYFFGGGGRVLCGCFGAGLAPFAGSGNDSMVAHVERKLGRKKKYEHERRTPREIPSLVCPVWAGACLRGGLQAAPGPPPGGPTATHSAVATRKTRNASHGSTHCHYPPTFRCGARKALFFLTHAPRPPLLECSAPLPPPSPSSPVLKLLRSVGRLVGRSSAAARFPGS